MHLRAVRPIRHNDETITWANIRRAWRAYALLSPILFLMIIFLYYPPLLGLARSFYRWELGRASVFVGLENFQSYFDYPETRNEFKNIGKLLVFFIFARVGMTFFMAELLYSVRSSFAKGIYRLFVAVPMVVPGIVTILVWTRIYDPNLGLLNTLLRDVGLDLLTQDWLGNPDIALFSVMGVGFPWVGGAYTLIYLGGLAQISEAVHDAALLDGCVGIRRAVLIDLPQVRGQVRFLLILAVIEALTSYENILVMTRGGPGFATGVPGLTMYQRAFTNGLFGYASAIGLILFIVAVCFTLIINRVFRTVEY